MTEAIALLQKLAKDHFYGRIELNMRDGRIELIRKEETIKIFEGNTREQFNR